jgi:hypothetical protein
MQKSPIHDSRPNTASPAIKPGESPAANDTKEQPRDRAASDTASKSDTRDSRVTPKRDGDNSGGESTASTLDSSDQGHVHVPRPGEHQGGH